MYKQGYEILEESDIKWKGISLGGWKIKYLGNY